MTLVGPAAVVAVVAAVVTGEQRSTTLRLLNGLVLAADLTSATRWLQMAALDEGAEFRTRLKYVLTGRKDEIDTQGEDVAGMIRDITTTTLISNSLAL